MDDMTCVHCEQEIAEDDLYAELCDPSTGREVNPPVIVHLECVPGWMLAR